MSNRLESIATALLVCLFVAGCGDGRTPLVLYSPHGRDLLQAVEERFEQENPDVDVRWLDMGSQEVYDRVRSERANPQASVWFGGPATILARAADEGLLEPFRPSWAERVDAGERDPEGRYHAVYRTPTLIVYNRDALTETEAPSDWPELLEPRFTDRIVIRDPLASGTMRTIFGYLIADSIRRTGSPDDGLDYLRALDAQTREYVHSPALLHEKMSRQEGVVTLWEMTDILGLIDRGAPLGYRFPDSGTPVIADSVALVAGAPEREAAVRFLEWVGSEEALLLAAEQAFRLPAPSGLASDRLPAWVADVERSLVPADVDWQLLERQGPEWMALWDRSIRARGK